MNRSSPSHRGAAPSRPHFPSSSTAAAAFTLVELLVVIGIIAVLIGVLLPTLGAARANSQRVACMAKLRELGHGFLLYANSNRGVMAYQVMEPIGNPKLLRGVNRTWFGSSNFAAGTLTNSKYENSLLEPYFGKRAGRAVADCPTLTAMGAQVPPQSEDGLTPSYGGAYFISTADNDGNSYLKLTQIQISAETVMLADTALLADGGIYYANWTNEPFWLNDTSRPTGPRFHGRHRGQGNVLWFDGHVTSETPGYMPNASNYTGNGAGFSFQNSDTYKRMKFGYITRGNEPFTSANINYYYYVNKTQRRLRPR